MDLQRHNIRIIREDIQEIAYFYDDHTVVLPKRPLGRHKFAEAYMQFWMEPLAKSWRAAYEVDRGKPLTGDEFALLAGWATGYKESSVRAIKHHSEELIHELFLSRTRPFARDAFGVMLAIMRDDEQTASARLRAAENVFRVTGMYDDKSKSAGPTKMSAEEAKSVLTGMLGEHGAKQVLANVVHNKNAPVELEQVSNGGKETEES